MLVVNITITDGYLPTQRRQLMSHSKVIPALVTNGDLSGSFLLVFIKSGQANVRIFMQVCANVITTPVYTAPEDI